MLSAELDRKIRWLTKRNNFSRLMFARSGSFTFFIQLCVGTCTRILIFIGAKETALRIRTHRLSSIQRYRTECEQTFHSMISSGAYNLFLDFGAHAGEQSLGATKFLAVRAYEPDPRALVKLEARLRETPTGPHPFELFRLAVSNKDGTAYMKSSESAPDSTGGSTISSGKQGFQFGNSIEVATVDVYSILSDLIDPKKTIVKIDIEGEEYPVLSRMAKHPNFKKLGAVFVEFHQRKLSNGAWLSLLLTLTFWRHGLSRFRLIEWF